MRRAERYFEDYTVGENKTSWGRTITESDIITHAGQTGDWFPHHVDAEWCKTQPFEQRIAHGTLILAVAVGQTADEINSLSQSYGYERVRFVKPVFIGDTITSTLEVTDLRPHSRRGGVGFVDKTSTVVNQDGQTVLSFVHVLLVQRRNAAAQ